MAYKSAISIVLLLAANVLLAHPTTVSDKRSRATKVLAKRDSPSPYPGSGSPCTNEPQYLGFDYTNPSDASKVDNIHKSFCSDIGQLIVRGELEVDNTDTTIFGRYFNASDGEAFVLVAQVFQKMWDVSNGNAGVPLPLVSTFIFDNNDFDNECTQPGSPGDGSDSGPDDGIQIGAYTNVDPNDSLEKTHFCNAPFEYPDLLDILCTDLSDHPNVKMESLARIMLHEFTHYSSVGAPAGVGQIVDFLNLDDLPAYYPARSHALVDPNQDNNGVGAEINADSYAWLSANAFFAYTCETLNPPPPDNGNYNDPPNYVAGEPGDPS